MNGQWKKWKYIFLVLAILLFCFLCQENFDFFQVSEEKRSLLVYHMDGCGFCDDIVKNKQANGTTKLEQLKRMFNNNPNIDIIDYKYGRDPEADSFSSFPVIVLKTNDGEEAYNGDRSIDSLVSFILGIDESV